MAFRLIDQDALQELLDETLGTDSERPFVARYLKAVKTIITGDLARYRTYGPYWPILKKSLIEHGIDDFGTEYDESLAEIFSYPEPALNIAAAYVYSNAQMETAMYSNVHYLETTEGGGESLVVEDHDMESMIHADQLLR